MKLTPSKINGFMFFKMPLGWLSGMRVKSFDHKTCKVTIRFGWLNQNPFKSMFWAAQGMAAEMSTGVLVIKAIQDSGLKVSMLVRHQQGSFTKKATGLIEFTCEDGSLIANAIEESKETGEGQTVVMKSVGLNVDGVEVSQFEFTWGIKVKSEKV